MNAMKPVIADPRQPEFDVPPPEPVELLRQWLGHARNSGVADPGALSLATVDPGGHPSNRIVQVIDVRPAGAVFTSHAGSQKGRDIATTGHASGVLYWRETKQQVILTGPVDRLGEDDCDALWAARSGDTHPMSVASAQSQVLTDEEALRGEARRLAESGAPLDRPAAWGGYLLRPTTVEFWQGSPDRLHRRLRYHHDGRSWTSERLQP